MIKLTITEKGGDARALSFDKDEVSIGRVQGNDIVLPKGNISKRHTKLSIANGRISVSDLKSTNGTYVNGRKIAEATLVKPGDKVFVGDFLVVIDPSAAAAETTGSRRGPPPPPPPPSSRPHLAEASSPHVPEANGIADESGAGLAGLPGSGPTKGRPPAPPPPPPKRTVMTNTLMGDGVDIGGLDEPPPSPLDIEPEAAADIGDVLDAPVARSTVDVASPETDSESESATMNGDEERASASMFGASPLRDEDEDALPATDFPSSVTANQPDATLDSVDRPAESFEAQLTPPPVTSVPASAAIEPPVVAEEAPVVMSLDFLLGDPTVTVIVISPNGAVEIERAGKIEAFPTLGEGNGVAERVWQLANTAVPPPASDNPVVDVRLPDGTRVTALFPPITPMSVCAAIRKSTVPEFTLTELCADTPDVETILAASIAARCNILLAGDRPAVSAMAGAIAGKFPSDRRILSIGAGVKARPGWIELAPGGEAAALVRAAVAFRADHMLVADPQGNELPDLLLAAARGQTGVVAAVAARSAAESLGRLRTFCLGVVSPDAFGPLVTSTVDLIVFAGTNADGSVRVLEVVEPLAEGGTLTPSYVARRADSPSSSAALNVTGVSARLGQFIATAGEPLPQHLVRH